MLGDDGSEKELAVCWGTGAVGQGWGSQNPHPDLTAYQGHTAPSLISEASVFGGITHHFTPAILKSISKICKSV